MAVTKIFLVVYELCTLTFYTNMLSSEESKEAVCHIKNNIYTRRLTYNGRLDNCFWLWPFPSPSLCAITASTKYPASLVFQHWLSHCQNSEAIIVTLILWHWNGTIEWGPICPTCHCNVNAQENRSSLQGWHIITQYSLSFTACKNYNYNTLCNSTYLPVDGSLITTQSTISPHFS